MVKMRPEMINGFQKAKFFNLPCTANTGLYRCDLKAGHTIYTSGVHARFAKEKTVYWVTEFVYFEEC
jgi:hypothetical protein